MWCVFYTEINKCWHTANMCKLMHHNLLRQIPPPLSQLTVGKLDQAYQPYNLRGYALTSNPQGLLGYLIELGRNLLMACLFRSQQPHHPTPP